IEVLAEIPDPRQARGKRYPLTAVLALACVAMLCGYRSYGAIAEWGRNYGAALVEALGFAGSCTPCAATLHLLFRALDSVALEDALGRWAEGVLAATPVPEGGIEGLACDGKALRGSRKQGATGAHLLFRALDSVALEDALGRWAEGVLAATPVPEGGIEGLACDGKTLRGSRKQGATGAHLLSVVSQRLGLTVAQESVDAKTNEIPVLPEVLRGIVLEGRVVTVDALLTRACRGRDRPGRRGGLCDGGQGQPTGPARHHRGGPRDAAAPGGAA
nr:transposase family protein [Chloroflexota bacterium]